MLNRPCPSGLKMRWSALGRPNLNGEQGSSHTGLDLLRGLAALLVCVCHVRNGSFVEFGSLPAESRTLTSALFLGLCRLGHEAVLVFFVLSGFLVGGALIGRVAAGTFSLGSYTIDRASRIWLPLLPACLFTSMVNVYLTGEAASWMQIAGTMAGLNGVAVSPLPSNGPLWSIAYEIWFYIFGGTLAALVSGQSHRFLSLGLLLAAGSVFEVLYARYLLFWILGAVAVILVGHPRPRLLFVGGLALTSGGVFLYQVSRESVSLAGAFSAPQWLSETLICVGIAFMLPAIGCLDDFFKALHKPAAMMSGFSFSLYLTHAPAAEFLHRIIPRQATIDQTSLAAFFAKLAFCLVVAGLFYLAFERPTPFVRRIFKKRFLGASLAA